MPTQWRCEAVGCTNPPLPYHAQSDCPLCCKQFCMTHYESHDDHSCWPYRSGHVSIAEMGVENTKENDEMFSTLDMAKIISEASALRRGHTCTGPPQPFGPMREDSNISHGGINGHFALKWDDGVEWLVRMRQKRKSVWSSFKAMRLDLRSDAATCIALHQVGLKVPFAWMRPDDSQDDLHYFFVERVNGRPFEIFGEEWKREEHEPTDETYARIKEVAKFYISLESLTFPKCGSLTCNTNGEIEVGPRIGPNPIYSHPPWFVGPTDTAKHLYLGAVEAILQNCLADKMFRPSRAIFGYLVALELRELLLQCKEMDEGPWFICHGEPRGDHFLFDAEGELAGVVDWEWAYTSCKAAAMCQPAWYPDEAYFDGYNDPLGILDCLLGQAYIELGRRDLAETIPKARKYQRLSDFIGSSRVEPNEINALRRAFLGLPDSYRALQPTHWREWVKLKLEQHKKDEGLQTLLEKYTWDYED